MTKTPTIHAQQKWEYMEATRKTERYLLNDLNDIGQNGWELVSISHGKSRSGEDAWTAFLKRPFVAHGGHHEAAHVETLQEQARIEPHKLGE